MEENVFIKLEHISKTFPGVKALDNISLKIRKGDIFGIIGLSGAGKSTLIRCINRLDTPTEGKILIDGQNVPDMNKQQLRQMRRKVSMIFQQFNLLMQQTVAKNIAYPMECIGVPLSIRSADVHTLNGAQYGQLLISRPDDPMVCHRAIEYLKERGLTVEEVRA